MVAAPTQNVNGFRGFLELTPFLPLLLAVVALTVLAFPGGPAQAKFISPPGETPETLLSNLGRTAHSSDSATLDGGQPGAQPFRTGPGSYAITGVTVVPEANADPASLVATIREEAPDGPVLARPTNPASLSQGQEAMFMAEPGVLLRPETTYYFHVDPGHGELLPLQRNGDGDYNSASNFGWSLSALEYFSNNAWLANQYALRMEIEGLEVPLLEYLARVQSGATVNLIHDSAPGPKVTRWPPSA